MHKMDSITHTLFGLTSYGAINKEKMTKEVKKSLFLTSLIGSHIPDIDVISQLWDTEGMYQMWHRGITHSIFLVPLWALLLYGFCYLLWKVKDPRVFYVGCLVVFLHITIDLFNAWGTGYLEPFSSERFTFGTIPIIDFVIWTIMLAGFVVTKLRRFPTHKIYKAVWCLIIVHVMIQSVQGYIIHKQFETTFEQHVLAAGFVPWNYQVIGKKENTVEIWQANLWQEPTLSYELDTKQNVDLEHLFEQNPKARTLYEWSPFVVIIDDESIVGVYDPRFYRDGQSFLFEYIEKK
jgi:inner membrane protein